MSRYEKFHHFYLSDPKDRRNQRRTTRPFYGHKDDFSGCEFANGGNERESKILSGEVND